MTDDGTVQWLSLVLRGGADSDREELESYTLELRERVLELEVDGVVLERSGVAPEGAKPGEVFALGALVVTVAPFAMRSVVRLLESWIEHRPVRTVNITVGEDSLEVEAVSSADQRRLIDAFIARHASAPEPAAGAASQAPPGPVPDPGSAGGV
ncbi:hypothetical protein [Streptomyces sp. R35]|uniref:Uncharacterized protein n=1 Tax=Streptomyces sp. R35 TaxID=3238630 RepID=A0AB39SJT8_9ACTN